MTLVRQNGRLDSELAVEPPAIVVAHQPLPPDPEPWVPPLPASPEAAKTPHPASPSLATQVAPPAPSNGHCVRCRHDVYRDVEVHGGASVRRDCARCGRTVGWARWQGGPGAIDPRQWSPDPAPPRFDPWWLDDPALVGDVVDGPDQPARPAEPCRQCGCPSFWQDLTGEIHCGDCRSIPVRQMASGEAWQVAWSPAGNYWVDWTPEHWNPFAHLEAAEAAELAARPVEDF